MLNQSIHRLPPVDTNNWYKDTKCDVNQEIKSMQTGHIEVESNTLLRACSSRDHIFSVSGLWWIVHYSSALLMFLIALQLNIVDWNKFWPS